MTNEQAIEILKNAIVLFGRNSGKTAYTEALQMAIKALEEPQPTPERLTDDDFETIRIHLSAYKESLCNQRRWKEAEEYQRIIDRFMAFASSQPETYWTPCSERPPEEMGTYMTTVEYGKHGLAVGQRFYCGKYLGWEDECVIAWMPLPKPYKAERR